MRARLTGTPMKSPIQVMHNGLEDACAAKPRADIKRISRPFVKTELFDQAVTASEHTVKNSNTAIFANRLVSLGACDLIECSVS